ncbi:hypothetical protein EYZ11_008715 [Aspergillus tanneri]|uniref:Tautomerase cis-CaaD-like domain-containing protein n=1 Tax=Aspergillus tanneri TaxID=1220188 RepID=A0A4S3JA39_9EURO|nr:uncharacterized protein ATNIH1004_009196 [Aspergillus tanneri]KAA8644985.1 hypothetical protein ATNIH1004_009196 [Aspergillus tanneri]THC91822.1 hypothetical protein EYZ11_008715 [Aspergillus tanneri]
MPLWQIYHPPGSFEDDSSRAAFAEDITKIYTSHGLPAFYVVINFIKLDHQDIFVGGKQKTKTEKLFIRLVITHIAVKLPDEDAAFLQMTSRIDQALKPHIIDKGWDFEYHVDETDRRLWKINGIIPPPFRSEEEKIWSRENRPVPYEGGYASQEPM